MGFGLMMSLIIFFDTARDYTLDFTITHTLMPTVMLHFRCFVAAFNGGRSPFTGLPNGPGLNYKLPTATTHNYSTATVL
jgi:hypothetical protein